MYVFLKLTMKCKLLALSILIALLSIYFGFFHNITFVTYFKSFFFENLDSNNVNSFTTEQLKQYNGETRKELYLSILGNVYDVTKASKHYGPGETYHIFVGKDASKAFITGNFNEETISGADDVHDLKPDDLLSLKNWKQFYDKEYIKKGILIGRYYDVNGNPTKYLHIIENLIKEAENTNENKQLDEQKYPPCNIEWNPESGTRVWCTNQSGGITRNWIGVPRKYYKAGATTFRCACVKNLDDPKLEEYENCDTNALSCNIKVD